MIDHRDKNSTDSEYVAYHKVKRKFLSLMDAEIENPDDLEMYEFNSQNLNLLQSDFRT